MSFANALLMTVRSFMWTEATTESTKHQKVEATSFDETCEVKKATNFEKLHDMKKEKKKEHLRLAISSHFRRKIFNSRRLLGIDLKWFNVSRKVSRFYRKILW